MDRTLDSVGNGYILCILGDLNEWIGDRTRVVKLCEETGLCVGNTYLKNRSLHKYT